MPSVNRGRGRLELAKRTVPTTIREAMDLAEIKHSSMPNRKVRDIWEGLPVNNDVQRARWILIRCIHWGINVDRLVTPVETKQGNTLQGWAEIIGKRW